LQPGVPSLGRCVTLLPATFCNLGLGDPLSSCNKRIVFISYYFFAWQTCGAAQSQDFTRIGFCFAKLAWTETNCDDLELSSTPSMRTWSFLRLIVQHRAPPDDRQVT
jgi:hypothetical protein